MMDLKLWQLLALPLLCAVLCIFILTALHKSSAKFSNFGQLYRIVFSALAASLCPTLVMAGHGAIPLPTLSGLVLVLIRVQSIQELRLSNIAFGSDQAAILILPFALSFVVIYLTPLSRAKEMSREGD